jgi:hypothetical protein
MLTDSRSMSTAKAIRRRITRGGPRDNDQGLLRSALVMLAVGDAVGAIFVLKTAICLCTSIIEACRLSDGGYSRRLGTERKRKHRPTAKSGTTEGANEDRSGIGIFYGVRRSFNCDCRGIAPDRKAIPSGFDL